MQEAEYSLIEQVQDRHWWWTGRRRIISALLAEHFAKAADLAVADVGCGFGANVAVLLDYGRLTCVETHPRALAKLKEQWPEQVTVLPGAIPDNLGRRFDLILLADVLEHIADEAAAVAWLGDHLNEGGHVLLTVPAHRLLWTQMDDVVGHCRRYGRRQLERLLAGRFDIVRSSYYNLFLLPAKLAFVAFDRLKRLLLPRAPKRSYNDVPPGPINWLFGRILAAEAPILRRSSLPWGVSLIVLARKR